MAIGFTTEVDDFVVCFVCNAEYVPAVFHVDAWHLSPTARFAS